MTNKRARSAFVTTLCSCFVALIALVSSSGGAVSVPTVTAAKVPLYPPVVQKAHIEGLVKLRVTTDGARPSSIHTISGQPMLCAAAIENVKTWEFAPHAPTTFEVSFDYRLLPAKCDKNCDCPSKEAPSVTLRLPTEIEVKATEVMICDPIEYRR